jgi:hypothetical protein
MKKNTCNWSYVLALMKTYLQSDVIALMKAVDEANNPKMFAEC